MGFAAYRGATGCGDGPTGGAIDLQTTLVGQWSPQGAYSLGIYACRRVVGSTAWSVHAEGRALDLGVRGGQAQLVGDEVLEQLLQAHDEALQRVIWDRKTFDLLTPLGRPYTGRDPHTGHLHIELSWAAARGEIPLGLPLDQEEDEDPMPNLIVAFRGAQWCVSPDLTARVGLASGVDVQALLKINGGRSYVPSTLSEALMLRIPEVSAL